MQLLRIFNMLRADRSDPAREDRFREAERRAINWSHRWVSGAPCTQMRSSSEIRKFIMMEMDARRHYSRFSIASRACARLALNCHWVPTMSQSCDLNYFKIFDCFIPRERSAGFVNSIWDQHCKTSPHSYMASFPASRGATQLPHLRLIFINLELDIELLGLIINDFPWGLLVNLLRGVPCRASRVVCHSWVTGRLWFVLNFGDIFVGHKKCHLGSLADS